MYYTVFSLNFQRWFFHFIRRSGVKLSEFFLNFIKPDRNESWPDGYIKFLDDLKDTIEGELHDKSSDVIKKGEFSDFASGTRLIKNKERKKIQSSINDVYEKLF